MRLTRRKFFVSMATLMAALVVVGFWPSYFGLALSDEEFQGNWVLHLHAVVFLAWMGALVAQTALVAQGHTRVHMSAGPAGFLLGCVVFVMGVLVSFRLMHRLISERTVSTWTGAMYAASAPLVDIVQFAILIGIGYIYRRKREFHGRYMLLATVAILPAATSRMEYLMGSWSLEMAFAVLFALLVAYDVRTLGRIHTANIVGLLILLPRIILNISFKFDG